MIWIDYLRGAAILLVIFYHSTSLLPPYFAPPRILSLLSEVLGPLRMPTLAFLSGIIAHHSLQKSFPRFALGKLRSLIWPYVVWSAIYWTIEFTSRGVIYGPTDYRLYISYLWYLAYIFLYYFISKLLPNVPRMILSAIGLSAAALIPSDIDAARRFFYLWAAFTLGELAGGRAREWRRLTDSRWSLLASVPVVLAISATASGRNISYDPMWAASTFAGLIVLTYLSKKFTPGRLPRVQATLAFLGRHSIVYYTSHFPTLVVVIPICAELGIFAPWQAFAIGICTSLLVGTILALLAQRNNVTAALFVLPTRQPPVSSQTNYQ